MKQFPLKSYLIQSPQALRLQNHHQDLHLRSPQTLRPWNYPQGHLYWGQETHGFLGR